MSKRKKRFKPKPARRDAFYRSAAWKKLRYLALCRAEGRCQCCGVTANEGARLNVDHIKPRRRFPHLALDIDNLQILCASCNAGKGNHDETDWRPIRHASDIDVVLDLAYLSVVREAGYFPNQPF